VSSRKRGRQEMEDVEPPKERSMLDRIRNTWEFANLAQYIFTFGRAVKIDENLDIEVSLLEPLHELLRHFIAKSTGLFTNTVIAGSRDGMPQAQFNNPPRYWLSTP